MNKCCLIGRLVKDVELRYTANNIPVAQFTLAVNTGRKNEQGNDIADFINIIVWNKQAENCNKYIGKGSQIGVLGRITTSSYEKDGHKIYRTDVVAEQIQYLDTKKQNASGTLKEDKNLFEEFANEIQQEDLPF